MKKLPLTPDEVDELINLIEWAVNGSEHGVITHSQWQEKCKQLKTFLELRGYKISGQFFL